MDKPRPCGCKGCRTCLICEKDYGIDEKQSNINLSNGNYVYCPQCNKAWPGWDLEDLQAHPNHNGKPITFEGVYIKLDFITDAEEASLIKGIDSMPWDLSQSGRRKQNFGPKCNFKKRKLKLGNFKGFPKFSQCVQDKFQNEEILEGFYTVEQCSLEYDPSRGASIDPHIDDCWIWGERIVTVNLLSDSVLTMTYNQKTTYYNLDCVENYPSVLNSDGKLSFNKNCYILQNGVNEEWPVVRIPMPRRSLIVMYGAARYNWEHQVLRKDIKERRVCLAYREFTPPYLQHGNLYEEGKIILDNAASFF